MASLLGQAAAAGGRSAARGSGCGLAHRRQGWPTAGVDKRGKFDVAMIPPWKRYPKDALRRINYRKLPEVEARIDILTCSDPTLVADAICEVVPWKRKWAHHEWLHSVCAHVRKLLPDMTPRDVVRIILSFGQLYTKRKSHTLLFHDYETYASLFQALPIEAATGKTLLPLVRCYQRMGVSHVSFFRAACERVVSGVIELEPPELTELVSLHGNLGIRAPKLFNFVAEVLDLRFAYFTEDQIGDIARAFVALRFRCDEFIEVLKRELPYRLHEYAWWNLIDIAEMYLVFQVEDREMVERFGSETFKLILSMNYGYAAKALRVLAFLETGDKRTFRLLIRNVPRCIDKMDALAAGETVMALAAISVEPDSCYHRTWGSTLYQMLSLRLVQCIGALSTKKTCDVFAALARVGQPEAELAQGVQRLVAERPYKFHAEHLVSLLRDFATLRHTCPAMGAVLLSREGELAECTPSALCAVPAALAAHRAPGERGLVADAWSSGERAFLVQVSALLCKAGAYKMPSDPRAFRSKDDLWWKQLRQRHFRLRRRAREAGTAVAPAAGAADAVGGPADAGGADDAVADAAIFHVTRDECLQLVAGAARLRWRDEQLLQGATAWLCEGRRHAELSPREVSMLLGAFSELGFASPLLRAALEHGLLRTAPEIPAGACRLALRGALDVGMGVRSAAVRALLRRCTSELPQVPIEELVPLRELDEVVRARAEEEVLGLSEAAAGALSALARVERVPLEVHLFGEAVAMRSKRANWSLG